MGSGRWGPPIVDPSAPVHEITFLSVLYIENVHLPMRKIVTAALLSIFTVLGFSGCDLLNSQNVQNPQLTEDQGLSNPNPLDRWVAGLDRQMAIALNNTVVWTELTTDNYVNTQTFYNQAADGLEINFQSDPVGDAFFDINDLRESAQFGKSTVLEKAEDPDPGNVAELSFYGGMGHLLLGEYFRSAPLDGGGEQATPSEHFQAAIDTLQNAIDSGNGDQVGYKLAQARAYYDAGNQSEATRLANEVLNADPDYVRLRKFDNQNGPTNVMQNALYDRSSFDDLQPLPRLDFLDPKFGQAGSVETPFPLLKAEEAHLILIEAALADGDLPSAKSQMKDLITLVETERDPRMVDETIEGRTHDDPGSRPDNSGVEVRASPNDPFRSGLVIDRTATSQVADVSDLSVTDSRVDNVSNADEAWELYYLMRQQIFIAEGRRFTTMGFKAPVPFDEVQINEAYSEGSDPTKTFIPSYVTDAIDPANGITLDSFEYDESAGTATIDVNMNRVLANNRSSVSPFLQ